MSERLRVLQVTAIPITAVRFVEPLARALRENGCDVEFASGPGRGAEELERRGFSVHRFPISRNPLDWRNGRAIRRLRSFLERRSFDVVHTHTPAAAAVARIAALGSRAASFYTMHGSFWGAGVSAGRRTLYTLLERALARRTDTIFTVNPEDAADCVDRARVGRDHVITLPAGGAGVDPDFFVDQASVDGWRREAREELGVPPDASVVAYVGRTAAAKGMGVLARSFARLFGQLPHVKLLVVGGPLQGDRKPYNEARFRREVGEAASRHVVWTGFTDRVAPLIAAADAVVLPSRREGFGMSLAEAAAIGRPVVATNTRGARAVVEDGVTGLLVPVDDHLALAEGLLTLLRDPERRSRMGEVARRRAGDRFTRAGVLAVYLERYRGLQNGAGA